MQVLKQCLAIGIAGFLGALARFFVGRQFQKLFETSFPIGTMLVNLSGCFALGLFMAMIDGRIAVSETTKLAISIGFIGTYTTFSTLMYESVKLAETGDIAKSLANLVASMLLGLLAVRIGALCGGRI